jgi:predicted transcriptional regulator
MSAHRVVTAHLPTSLATHVDALAERMARTGGWVLQEALEQDIALEHERHALTLAAIADVTAQRVSTHVEVETWAMALVTRKKAATRRACSGAWRTFGRLPQP